MIVYADGTTRGTIGGGAVELIAIKDAMKCIENGTNAYKEYDLTSPSSNTGMTCGGDMSVLIEAFIAKPLLVMIGAGHVGAAVMHIAEFIGYDTLLIDDRADEQIADKIAAAGRFVRVKDFEAEIKHGHTHDGAALAGVLDKNAAYIGMIGSSKKIAALFAKLTAQGASEEQLSTVYTPIGLDIGGETPEEIAVSIMAQIQQVRYGAPGGPCRTLWTRPCYEACTAICKGWLFKA